MGEWKNDGLQVKFDRKLRLEFHGVKVTSDAGLLPYRELDEVFELPEKASDISVGNQGSRVQTGWYYLEVCQEGT